MAAGTSAAGAASGTSLLFAPRVSSSSSLQHQLQQFDDSSARSLPSTPPQSASILELPAGNQADSSHGGSPSSHLLLPQGSQSPGSLKKGRRKGRTVSFFDVLLSSRMNNGKAGTSSKTPASRSASRSESMAYPKNATSSVLVRAQYYCRQHNRPIVLSLVVAALLLLGLSSEVASGGGGKLAAPSPGGKGLRGSIWSSLSSTVKYHWGGSIHDGYFYPSDAVKSDTEFSFGAVTDLDELSRVKDSSKPEFYSIFLGGKLTRKAGTGDSARYEISLNEADKRTLVTKHNEAGRGAEFSELTIYQNRLITLDDRTGEVFEILNDETGKDSFVVPRFVITEGPGETDKGMKWEWSTVKNDELYLGSMGKEYTLSDGTVKNRNNLWIVVVNSLGQVRREDWTDQYQFVRHALGCDYPGYLIIEAINWSPALRKWIFLPRRISTEAYDDVKDEKRGGQKLILVDEKFTDAKIVDIQMPPNIVDPLKGFSTFAFVPNTGDRHALAVRSVEDQCVDFTPACKQRSYFVVFDVVTGKVLSDEVMAEDQVKFEGVEFVDINKVPPVPPQG